MFFTVENPDMPPANDRLWIESSPQKFDGRAANLFQNTSMHLSFTNWERPLDDSNLRGNQDVQVSLMECVIRIREAGRWVGDVDILLALKSPAIYRLSSQKACSHSKRLPPDVHLNSIENWDELRSFHAGNVVVRANGNPLARLATTVYLAQCANKGQGAVRRITICPSSVCWQCLEATIQSFPSNVYIY